MLRHKRLILACWWFIAMPLSLLAADAAKTGRLRLTFDQRNPLSAPDEMAKRLKLDPRRWPGPTPAIMKREWEYNLADESFDVVIPPRYSPREKWGLLVWTGVTDFSPEWFDVLARHKLLFVTPIKRGDHVPKGLWLDAAHNMRRLYNIDDDRVYTCGFSDGGRNASFTLVEFPEVFSGCLCLAGDDFYDTYDRQLTVEGKVGSLDPKYRKTMRIVMIRGERDRFTPAEGRLQYEGLLLDGFERVTFLVAPGIGHNHANAAWFEKGITALDHAELRKPPTTAPTSQPHPQVGQIAQAQRLFVTARLWHISPGPLDAGRGEARRYLKQLLDDYPTTPAAKQAREMLKMLDAEAATPRTAKPASRPLQATTRP